MEVFIIRTPTISITPKEALLDETVHIRLRNFEPNHQVVLRAETHTLPNMTFDATANATFVADENGQVDVAIEKPLSGSYTEQDAMGMFWSMQISNTKYNLTRKLSELNFEPTSTIQFKAEVGGVAVAEATFTFRHLDPVVHIEDVTANGLVGKFFYRTDQTSRPCVIVLGGGEGGLAPSLSYAALFASHGFPALALAYFNFESLPNRLRDIPLEYFSRAIDWLKMHPSVDSDKIVTFGRSKGAELALLLGATYPDIHGVVSSSPNAYVCIGDFIETADSGVKTYSSWTYNGSPLPFIDWTTEQCRKFAECMRTGTRVNQLHAEALQNAQDSEQCRIPVERINGPIMLISSDDDHWWDATKHSESIMNRLEQSSFLHEKKWLNYTDTGHVIKFPNVPTTQLVLNGGTAYNNAIASRHSWREIIRFLEEDF